MMRQMCTEMQTVKNQMTLQNWAQEVAECQSSGMMVSAWYELHGKNVKIYSFYEKYAKAVPLERLSKDFRSMKAEISTATLANWVLEASERYLKLIYEQLHTEILKERVIHADETVVQVLHEQDRKAKTQSRMWVYCTEKIKLYQYTQTRNGKNAETFLKGYKGYMVCDGYDGYNKLKNVTRDGCWAHARRKFYEALPLDEEIKKTSKANAGFERINQLFALEREYAALIPEKRYTQRQETLSYAPARDGCR